MSKRLFQKLVARFYDPFLVVARVGKVAYQLKLPAHSKIHPMFYISQLKPVIDHPELIIPLPLY